ncbi:hypothetical protein PUN4_1340004 [Paraburkholderia unamae]|nr:hypothetical protein PUN4_1340004 [Paraburkholderia unamae]
MQRLDSSSLARCFPRTGTCCSTCSPTTERAAFSEKVGQVKRNGSLRCSGRHTTFGHTTAPSWICWNGCRKGVMNSGTGGKPTPFDRPHRELSGFIIRARDPSVSNMRLFRPMTTKGSNWRFIFQSLTARRKRFASTAKRTQKFLSCFEQIRQHFAPKRHLLRASLYRRQLAARFVAWSEFTELAQNPSTSF